MNWIETIKHKLSGSEEQTAEMLAGKTEAVFQLRYRELPIGLLSVKSGSWRFEYTAEFKKQDKITPLINFPDKNKIYEQKVLWPFFASRIPGIAQPRVQQILKEKRINENSTVDLLRIFGKKSISNPFLLDIK